MTVQPRGGRARRGGRRPGWMLLTVLLVLAILASSALVFTNRVELLKLAVILALWAAVVAAFVSVIYRRQSDVDQAKARDLKLVYDLQLDREISARREYELTVESQLRRELAHELRAQAADEVAALRAELAALRTNLEILFDTDLAHRPAIEHDRTTVRAYSDWATDSETTGRVSSSRLDEMLRADEVDDTDVRTEESPIIDVPAEPQPPEPEPVPEFGGAHRRPSEAGPAEEERGGRRRRAEEPQPQPFGPQPEPFGPQPQPFGPQPAPFGPQPPNQWQRPAPAGPYPPPPPHFEPQPQPEPQPNFEPQPQPEPEPQPGPVAAPDEWQPAPAEGAWIPAGAPGSNWVPGPTENGSAQEYVGRRRAPEPAMTASPVEVPRGRHSAPADTAEDESGREEPAAPPVLAAEPSTPPPPPAPAEEITEETPEEAQARRHRSVEDTGGQSVADLLARLQASPATGGGRRRREE
ncbi:DUF6779 domain-containing protein [Mycobacterium sp. PS03-16]|uniref:DUF6779 domain-containing protein n=1 Tax=Mycobacterium sp. PS03-16 TaxID=2559611 RepID=UPI001ADD9FEC|nr:DUF6779 domain-containing protein [Mycobacterium sp. PS03-16]